MENIKIKFWCREKNDYSIIFFKLNSIITPEFLPLVNPPKINPTKGVVLSGRGPIWFYGYLIHYYHPTKFVATYDPRLGGAVVIESHSSKYKIGNTIKIDSVDVE